MQRGRIRKNKTYRVSRRYIQAKEQSISWRKVAISITQPKAKFYKRNKFPHELHVVCA